MIFHHRSRRWCDHTILLCLILSLTIEILMLQSVCGTKCKRDVTKGLQWKSLLWPKKYAPALVMILDYWSSYNSCISSSSRRRKRNELPRWRCHGNLFLSLLLLYWKQINHVQLKLKLLGIHFEYCPLSKWSWFISPSFWFWQEIESQEIQYANEQS